MIIVVLGVGHGRRSLGFYLKRRLDAVFISLQAQALRGQGLLAPQPANPPHKMYKIG
jgi:hypothetical protein